MHFVPSLSVQSELWHHWWQRLLSAHPTFHCVTVHVTYMRDWREEASHFHASQDSHFQVKTVTWETVGGFLYEDMQLFLKPQWEHARSEIQQAFVDHLKPKESRISLYFLLLKLHNNLQVNLFPKQTFGLFSTLIWIPETSILFLQGRGWTTPGRGYSGFSGTTPSSTGNYSWCNSLESSALRGPYGVLEIKSR